VVSMLPGLLTVFHLHDKGDQVEQSWPPCAMAQSQEVGQTPAWEHGDSCHLWDSGGCSSDHLGGEGGDCGVGYLRPHQVLRETRLDAQDGVSSNCPMLLKSPLLISSAGPV
jgi:hypothetical protein